MRQTNTISRSVALTPFRVIPPSLVNVSQRFPLSLFLFLTFSQTHTLSLLLSRTPFLTKKLIQIEEGAQFFKNAAEGNLPLRDICPRFSSDAR